MWCTVEGAAWCVVYSGGCCMMCGIQWRVLHDVWYTVEGAA